MEEAVSGPANTLDPSVPGHERRRHARYELIAQVRVTRGRVDLVMEMVNISLSGALIDMGRIAQPRWLAVGRLLEIAITHPVSYDLVNLKGKIVRVVEDNSGTKFAVEFAPSRAEAAEQLKNLIQLAAESPVPTEALRRPPPLPIR